MRHPWQGPGTLSQLTVLYKLEQVQTTTFRFLVPARNDGLEANSKDYTFVLIIKRRAVLLASADAKHRKDKRMSSSLELAFEISMLFFCSYVLLS